MSNVILYIHPDYTGPFELIETPDGERRKYTNPDDISGGIRKQLQDSNIQFTESRLDEGDCMRHQAPFGGRAFVVVEFNDDECTPVERKTDHHHSIEGAHHRNFPSSAGEKYDHASLLAFLNG